MIGDVAVRYVWAESWDKHHAVFVTWMNARKKKGNPVSEAEADFIWQHWKKPTLDLLIPEEDYEKLFPGTWRR